MDNGLIPRFEAQSGEGWESIVERVSSISRRADRHSVRALMQNLMLLPSGQILRGAGRQSSVLASCTVATAAGRDLEDLVHEIKQTTKLGVGVGANVSLLPEPGPGSRSDWLHQALTAIARAQEGNARAGLKRTATGVVLDWRDAPSAPMLARLLSSAPMYRHLTLSIRVRSNAVDAEASKVDRISLGQIAEAATQFGMPGLIFQDQVNACNPYDLAPEAANPCVEQHLAPDETCILATVNLGAIFASHRSAWTLLKATVSEGTRLLADALDASDFPSARAAELARERRRLGIGVSGFSTALKGLGVPYDSKDAVSFAEEVGRALADTASAEASSLRIAEGLSSDAYHFTTSIPPSGAVAQLACVQPGLSPQAGTPRTPQLAARYVEIVSAFQRFVDNGISATVPLPADANASSVLDLIATGARSKCKGLSFFRDNTSLDSFALAGK